MEYADDDYDDGDYDWQDWTPCDVYGHDYNDNGWCEHCGTTE
jgi:hypothetical protein